MITVLDDSLCPRVGEARGREMFMLCKKTISSSSCGRPCNVGMASSANFFDLAGCRDVRGRLPCDAEASSAFWRFDFVAPGLFLFPRILMGVKSILELGRRDK